MPKGAGSAWKDDGNTARKADYIMINKTWGVSLIISDGCALLFLSPSFFPFLYYLLIIVFSPFCLNVLSLFIAPSLLLSLTRPCHFSFLPFLTLLTFLPSFFLNYILPSFFPPSSPSSLFPSLLLTFFSFHLPTCPFSSFPLFCPLLSIFLSLLLSHSLFLYFSPHNPFFLPCHSSNSFSPSFLSVHFLLLPSL